MDLFVFLQISLLRETPVASWKRTSKRLFPSVGPDVIFQIAFLGEYFIAIFYRAFEELLSVL
jgi:hypothetical protein